MTLHDIENALPPIITFEYGKRDYAEVHVCENHMGNLLYDSEGELYYTSLCYYNDTSEYTRRNTFLSYFNYELLLSIRQGLNSVDLQIYRLEPKFRVVYK